MLLQQQQQQQQQADCWLGVDFRIPGGLDYTACYRIPLERVTFPPAKANPKNLADLDMQIISAQLSFHRDPPALTATGTGEEDDDKSITSDSPREGSPETPHRPPDAEKEEEEEEEEVLVDFTQKCQSFSGPNGTFFGRKDLDLRLALAETIDSQMDGGQRAEFFSKLLCSACGGGGPRFAVRIVMGDGTEVCSPLEKFVCRTSK